MMSKSYLKRLIDEGRLSELLQALEPASKPITTPSNITKIMSALHGVFRFKARQESFYVLTLGNDHSIIAARETTRGLANRTIIHPREVFGDALMDKAVAVVLVHNHPSGNLDPSMEDREVTRRLEQAGELLGIMVLDHLIVDAKAERYFSFIEHGLLSLKGGN